MPLFTLRRLAHALLLLALAAPGEPPTVEQVQRHIDRGRWEQCVAACREIVEGDAENGMAWFLLAYGLHNQGDLEQAIEVGQEGLLHGAPRAATLYNLACAYALTDRVETAEETLVQAIEAGYLDFDSIASDEDLAEVRRRGNVALPEPYDFKVLKGRNGVEMRYELILPEGYDAAREYPAVVLFSDGHGPLSAAWSLANLCDGVTRRQGCIVLVLVAPERGWWTHPTHHALEDLLKHVRKQHPIEGGKYHLVGFRGGSRPAGTYSGMSGSFFQSLTVLGGRVFEGDPDREIRRDKQLRFAYVASDRDEPVLREAERVIRVLDAAGGRGTLRALPGEDQALSGLHHGLWLKVVAEELGLGDAATPR